MTGEQDHEAGLDRIATIPNAISVIRLLCVPVFLWLLFGRENRLGAALLLGGLGATDWIDGYIARHFNQVSDLGKVLDPIADKVLLVTGMIAILIDGSVPPIIFWPAIAREVLVAATTVLLGAMGSKRIDVSWAGKCEVSCRRPSSARCAKNTRPRSGARENSNVCTEASIGSAIGDAQGRRGSGTAAPGRAVQEAG